MIRVLLAAGLALTLVGAHGPAAHYLTGPDGLILPDGVITPGATVSGITKSDVCQPGYAAGVRAVTEARKVRACLLYGQYDCPGKHFEIDHLVSLELGGSNDLTNLWPQPIDQARMKDKLENYLHREVCGGTITLEHAQQAISTDWASAYHEMEKPAHVPAWEREDFPSVLFSPRGYNPFSGLAP